MTGYEIANEAVVAGLRALGHEVCVFGFKLPRQSALENPETYVLDTMNVENASASRLQKLKWLFQSHLSKLPISASKLTHVSEKTLLEEVSKRGPFDGNIINSYQMAAAFPKILNVPYFYVAHNVEHRSASENALSTTGMLERYLYNRDARILKDIEARLCGSAQYVWTLSKDDLTGHGVNDGRGGVLPLITPQQINSSEPQHKTYDVGLIGTWSWQPNFVGLKWFLENIVPQLPEDMKIAIAGSVPQGVAQQHQSVKFLGRVENAADFLNSVHVVPLVSRGGTGVQLKTIEALQSGYACVATASSLRGIEELPTNCIAADDATEFANAVSELVSKSKNGSLATDYGSAFYDNQKAAMMRELENGLSRLC